MSEPSVTPNNVPLSLNASVDSTNAPRIKRSPGIEGPDASRSAGVWIGVVAAAVIIVVAALVVSRFF
ncbi:hypothetical protein SAMN06309944_1759 [Micrococcales bacterium KH10]|nr:hypothetical protein SAMN06309944_1759 [Micrococcales bacterium KH10]